MSRLRGAGLLVALAALMLLLALATGQPMRYVEGVHSGYPGFSPSTAPQP